MNAVEIEQAISELAEQPFDLQEARSNSSPRLGTGTCH